MNIESVEVEEKWVKCEEKRSGYARMWNELLLLKLFVCTNKIML